MSSSQPFYCKYDFCTSAFRALSDLNVHLQDKHVEVQQPEEVFCKRRKVAPGIYILLSSQRLAEQIPMRPSQTTGDITTTTTTTTDLTFDLTSPYPPSFPSQPPELPSGVVVPPQTDDMDFLSLFTQGGSFHISPKVKPSALATTGEDDPTSPQDAQRPIGVTPPRGESSQQDPPSSTQYPLPTTSSPFEPPTQAFGGTIPSQGEQSTQSSVASVENSQKGLKPSQKPSSPSPQSEQRLDKPSSRSERKRTRSPMPVPSQSKSNVEPQPQPSQTPSTNPTRNSLRSHPSGSIRKPAAEMPPPPPAQITETIIASSSVSSTTTNITNTNTPAEIDSKRKRTSSISSSSGLSTSLSFGQSPARLAHMGVKAVNGEEGKRKVSNESDRSSVGFSWGLGKE